MAKIESGRVSDKQCAVYLATSRLFNTYRRGWYQSFRRPETGACLCKHSSGHPSRCSLMKGLRQWTAWPSNSW